MGTSTNTTETKWRPNTPDEMIEVITAHKQGKTIEFRQEHSSWGRIGRPTFNFGDYQYRVKKVPREWWIFKGKLFTKAFDTLEDAQQHAAMVNQTEDFRIIHVREVIEE